MSTPLVEEPKTTAAVMDEASEYLAIHTGAIIGLLLALVSVIFPFTVAGLAEAQSAVLLAVAPLAALVLCLWALAKVRAAPELYTGARSAAAGAAIAACSLVGGSAYGAYVYATELPEGYTRASFAQLKPTDVEANNGQFIPPDVEPLRGEQVFIKGYIRPDSTNNGLRRGFTRFLLVRDNDQCCFGDVSDVKYYDQIAVRLTGGLTADLTTSLQRVGGTLSIRPGGRGEPPLVYTLEADYMK